MVPAGNSPEGGTAVLEVGAEGGTAVLEGGDAVVGMLNLTELRGGGSSVGGSVEFVSVGLSGNIHRRGPVSSLQPSRMLWPSGWMTDTAVLVKTIL